MQPSGGWLTLACVLLPWLHIGEAQRVGRVHKVHLPATKKGSVSVPQCQSRFWEVPMSVNIYAHYTLLL